MKEKQNPASEDVKGIREILQPLRTAFLWEGEELEAILNRMPGGDSYRLIQIVQHSPKVMADKDTIASLLQSHGVVSCAESDARVAQAAWDQMEADVRIAHDRIKIANHDDWDVGWTNACWRIATAIRQQKLDK